MKSRADLRNSVARRLGIVQEGRSPTGYAAARINEAYETIHPELEQEEIAYWPYGDADNSQDIPLHVFPSLVDYIAARMGHELISGDQLLEIQRLESRALSMLRTQTYVRWSGQPTRPDRY